MIIFGIMGLIVRYIDLFFSEMVLLSSLIGCLFLIVVFFMRKRIIIWKLVKVNGCILFFLGIVLGGNWMFFY